jgi:hypothetical protein
VTRRSEWTARAGRYHSRRRLCKVQPPCRFVAAFPKQSNNPARLLQYLSPILTAPEDNLCLDLCLQAGGPETRLPLVRHKNCFVMLPAESRWTHTPRQSQIRSDALRAASFVFCKRPTRLRVETVPVEMFLVCACPKRRDHRENTGYSMKYVCAEQTICAFFVPI